MGVKSMRRKTRSEEAQSKITSQLKYMPYFLIFDFALLTSALRIYLMPVWGLWHIPLFLYQCLLFTGFWHLIKFINKKLNKVYAFERGPLIRISLQIFITILVVTPIIVISLLLVNTYGHHLINEQIGMMVLNKTFQGVMMMMVLVVIFMFNFAFYTFHFFEHWQSTVNEKASLEVQAAELEREKSGLQYHHLKNQVNPHYLFNMLSSLDGLVHTNPDLASDFIRHMSKVYRYVLQHKESEVVSVEEELAFIDHYVKLLNIRYAQGLSIVTEVSEEAMDKGIVMITLQMLIDNAIKHNIVQSAAPLNIIIRDEGNYLHVHNNKQLRKQIETSNGTGLRQLTQLYSFLTDKRIVIEDTDAYYTIKIPLL